MWDQRPSFRFEIDNLSEKEFGIVSHTFVRGGCEWYLCLSPKKGESLCDSDFSLYLSVANHKSLGRGWERSVDYYFVLLNQSDKELYKTPIARRVGFCAETTASVFPKTLLSKGFLENHKLIVEIYIKVIEAYDGEGVGFASQVTLVRKILAEHPEIAEDFKPKNQVLKTEYMNMLRNTCSKLTELAEVGSKMDWLKSKLGEVSLVRKKVNDSDESRFQQLEERIENLELMESRSSFKMDCLKSKLEGVSLEKKKSDDTEGSRVQKLEERVKNLELMELGLKVDSFNSFLEEVYNYLESKTSSDADGSRVQQLEERLKNIELNLSCIKSKLEEVSLERKKSDEADGSQAKQLDERLKNVELLVFDLKSELAKSSDDKFSLLNDIDWI